MPWTYLLLALGQAGRKPAVMPQPPIKQISFERTYCFGTCPVYRVTIDADGTILYRGIAYVPHKGVYKGKVYGNDWKRLCAMFVQLRFFDLKSNYEVEVTDLPYYILTVVTEKGTKKVSDYGSTGPDTLWALQQLVDSVTLHVRMGADAEKLSDDPEGIIDVRVHKGKPRHGTP